MLIWKADTRKIDALAFSPDGRALAVGGAHLACRLIDATTGEQLWRVPGKQPFSLSLAFARDGSVVCKCGPLSIRSATNGSEVRKCGNWCQAFALSQDSRHAFVADAKFQDIVRRYDLATGDPRREVELEAGKIKRIAASPDGKLVAVLGCRRFHLLTTNKLEVVGSEAHRALSNGSFALRFSPCGRTLVYTAGRTLFVWDTARAREVAKVEPDTKQFMDAAFTPCGQRLITVSKDGETRVWETATWTCERTFAWAIGSLRAVAVSPDGTRAAAAGDESRVVVWDLDV
ncbi:MAG: WD40 repeat domain-containing protein [Planctomycetia bacterium]|nr:WD40 repeat domain-containing protein [Planctomycetia bacterium]